MTISRLNSTMYLLMRGTSEGCRQGCHQVVIKVVLNVMRTKNVVPQAKVRCTRQWSGTWQPSCWSCSTSSTQSPWPSPLKPWKRQTLKNGEGEHTSADSPKTGIEVRLFRRWVRFDKWQTSHVHCSGVYDLHCVCDTFAQTTLVAFLVV